MSTKHQAESEYEPIRFSTPDPTDKRVLCVVREWGPLTSPTRAIDRNATAADLATALEQSPALRDKVFDLLKRKECKECKAVGDNPTMWRPYHDNPHTRAGTIHTTHESQVRREIKSMLDMLEEEKPTCANCGHYGTDTAAKACARCGEHEDCGGEQYFAWKPVEAKTPVGLHITCARCKKPITIPGAILWGPPNKEGLCKKTHICLDCYDPVYAEAQYAAVYTTPGRDAP